MLFFMIKRKVPFIKKYNDEKNTIFDSWIRSYNIISRLYNSHFLSRKVSSNYAINQQVKRTALARRTKVNELIRMTEESITDIYRWNSFSNTWSKRVQTGTCQLW